MSEILHKRRSSMRTRGLGVGAAEKQMFKHNALKKESGYSKQSVILRPAKRTNRSFADR